MCRLLCGGWRRLGCFQRRYVALQGRDGCYLRMIPDVAVALEHLIADVAGKGADGLLAHRWILGQPRHEGVSQIVPSVRELSLFHASVPPCALPGSDRLGEGDVVRVVLQLPAATRDPMPCYRGVLGPHNGVYHPVPRGEWKVNRAEFEEKFIKAPPKAA